MRITNWFTRRSALVWLALLGLLLFSGEARAQGFLCTETSTVSVTAGQTTQIVALSGNRNVRVCGFSVSMSAAGTAKWVYGTGTDCATGSTDITAAVTLATGTPWTIFLPTGLVFRTAPGTALCLTAATGNVTGIVSWGR